MTQPARKNSKLTPTLAGLAALAVAGLLLARGCNRQETVLIPASLNSSTVAEDTRQRRIPVQIVMGSLIQATSVYPDTPLKLKISASCAEPQLKLSNIDGEELPFIFEVKKDAQDPQRWTAEIPLDTQTPGQWVINIDGRSGKSPCDPAEQELRSTTAYYVLPRMFDQPGLTDLHMDGEVLRGQLKGILAAGRYVISGTLIDEKGLESPWEQIVEARSRQAINISARLQDSNNKARRIERIDNLTLSPLQAPDEAVDSDLSIDIEASWRDNP